MTQRPPNEKPELLADRFSLPRLSTALNDEQFAIHTAALEWSLDAPITIRGEADIQSKRSWEGQVEPYRHQIENLITFCRRAPVTLLADDVGLGKTISAGLILSELTARRKVSRAFIVAPNSLLSQWQEELAAKFGMQSERATGQALPSTLRRNVPVVITNYHSLKSHQQAIADAQFGMAIFDEAHKMRNLYGTNKPPQFAVSVRAMLEQRFFKYVLMMTATPIQNRLWDLYSLVDLLTVAKGHANPLGSPGSFERSYIDDKKAIRIKPGRRDEFRRHLGNYIVRTRRADAKLEFPERQISTHKIVGTELDRRLLEIVQEIAAGEGLNHLALITLSQAVMSSPEALAEQLDSMAVSGTVPHEVARKVRSELASGRVPAKLNGLMSVIAELSGRRPDWRVVVFTRRISTQQAIGARLASAGVKFGFVTGGKAAQNDRAIAAFRKKIPDINVLVSTDAGAEGLNLQVANVLVNYDLPWNPMILEQRIGRIQRLRSEHKTVHVLNLVLAGSLEETIVARLLAKLQAVTESIGDIEGILESVGTDFDAEAFEEVIKKLVLASLQGANAERATQLMEQSIRDAKRVYDTEREVVNESLGDLRDMHLVGPRVPEIAPVVPSIDAAPFVLRALRADGARIQERANGTHLVQLPGQNEFVLTFEDDPGVDGAGAVFSGNAPRSYAPGKRYFERLTQSWADKCCALVGDVSSLPVSRLDESVRGWVAGRAGIELESVTPTGRVDGFHGEITWRASVAVEHDRLEKLVVVPVSLGAELPPEDLPQGLIKSRTELEFPEASDAVRTIVSETIHADSDLSKFMEFYRRRLDEEIPLARSPALEDRVRQQFSQSVAAEAVSARGVKFAVFGVAAKIKIESQGPYETTFEIRPWHPLDRAVRPLEEWVKCSESGLDVPESATAACSVSGVVALRHRMVASAESGLFALKEHMVKCEETGAMILPVESEVCSITGKKARRGALGVSAVSGRHAVRSELVRCDFSGVYLLPSEAVKSAISAKTLRLDQALASVVSGRLGHASEFVASVSPSGWIAMDEAGQSALSGEWAEVACLRKSDKPPHRLGLPHELCRCAVSGRMLLRDEVEFSAVSGESVDRDLLVPSSRSGRFALPKEMAVCDVTGKRLLPDEVVRCAVTGKTVDARETEGSDISGSRALRGRLIRCPETGKMMLEAESAVCAASGARVAPAALGRCVVTGRRAVQRNMPSCPSSGQRFIDDAESRQHVHEVTGKFVVLQRCAWSGDLILGTILRRCAITGIQVKPEYLNVQGEFAALRTMLDGKPLPGTRIPGRPEIDRVIAALRDERSCHSGLALDAPARDLSVMVLRIRVGVFGLGSSYVAVAVDRGTVPQVLGGPVDGRREAGTWIRGATR
jgi:superfamily II DNA or RNA helicase